MKLYQAAAAAAMVMFFSLLLLPFTIDAHNITRILAESPEFSTFNHYLTVTQIAPEINRRETITVCAVENNGMADLLAKNLTIGSIKDVLSLHVILDYYDDKKLHQITNGTALAATLFQSSGSASGTSGFVNITDLKGGKVAFSPGNDGGGVSATYVKSIKAIPYNISVVQISTILLSTEAAAPAPAPSQMNLTSLMSAHGCKIFAETLLANPSEKTFESNIESGLTIFCPEDDAMKGFMPKYNNLSTDGKQSLLEYHGIPVYESLAGLRSSNGVTKTLATDRANRYSFTVQNDGDDVRIKTKTMTAKIDDTVIDKQPLAIYQLNKVLMPAELFKSAPTPAPAPTPSPEADAPSPPAPPTPSDAPADAPAGDVDDRSSDGNKAVQYNAGIFGAVILSLWLVFSKP